MGGSFTDNPSFNCEWLTHNAAIKGASGSSYTHAAADAGKPIKVRVKIGDDGGHKEEALTRDATYAVGLAGLVDADIAVDGAEGGSGNHRY